MNFIPIFSDFCIAVDTSTPTGYATNMLSQSIYVTVWFVGTLYFVYSSLKIQSNGFVLQNRISQRISMFAAVFVTKILFLLLMILYADCVIVAVINYNNHGDLYVTSLAFLIQYLFLIYPQSNDYTQLFPSYSTGRCFLTGTKIWLRY